MQNKKFLAGLGIFTAIALAFFLFPHRGVEPKIAPATSVSTPAAHSTTTSTSVQGTAKTGAKEAPHITLRAGDATYTASLAEPESVLEAMQQLASTTSFRFTAKEYPSLGLFIESINGRANTGGSYWFLYINGTSSLSGASTAIIKPGDLIEWKYE